VQRRSSELEASLRHELGASQAYTRELELAYEQERQHWQAEYAGLHRQCQQQIGAVQNLKVVENSLSHSFCDVQLLDEVSRGGSSELVGELCEKLASIGRADTFSL